MKRIGWPLAAGVATMAVVVGAGVASRSASPPVARVSAEGRLGSGVTAEFKVDGMFCPLCAATLGRVLTEQAGVLAAHVDFDRKVAVVRYDAAKTTTGQLKSMIEGSEIFRAALIANGPSR